MKRLTMFLFFAIGLGSVLPAKFAIADLILLNGTATFTQDGGYSPAQAVDDDYGDNNGWAILGGTHFDQIVVWETAVDLNAPAIQFQMHFLHPNPFHLMGRFRFSVTSDDRNSFADGLNNSGDVTANWSVLANPVVSGPVGMTFTVLGDNSILAGGAIAPTGIYTVNYTTVLTDVTGIRLESLIDPTVPGNGFGNDSNFLLTELDVSAVPEPSSMLLLGLASTLLFLTRRHNKR